MQSLIVLYIYFHQYFLMATLHIEKFDNFI